VTLLALALLACFIWAVIASAAAHEWRERAIGWEEAYDDLADEITGRRSS
jgi:hypothetical protein